GVSEARPPLEQFDADSLSLLPRHAPVRLDADHRHRLAASLHADQRRAEDVGMSVEDRLARDGEQGLVGQDDTVRFPAAEPEPPAVVEVAHVAYAMIDE